MACSKKISPILFPILFLFAVLFPGSAGASPTGSDPAESTAPKIPKEAKVAGDFSRLFMEDKFEACLPLMDETMKKAFTPEQAKSIRSSLLAENGPLKKIAAAWHEDDVQGYKRYRVPVVFEKATIDFRVVMDGAGRVAGFFLVPHAEPPDPNEKIDAPGEETEVEIGAGDRALPGTLTVPRAGGPFPAVVLVHGSGPNDRDETLGLNTPFRDLAWGLAERGIAVLRYDKRSFAQPDTLMALGEDLTVEQEVVVDARAGLELLRETEKIDPEAIYVLGHSLGGTLAPRIAEATPRPTGVIILAGATLPLPEKMLEQTRYIVSLDGTVTDAEKEALDGIHSEVARIRSALEGDGPAPEGMILGAPIGYYRDLEEYDPAARAAALGVPCLVLQGGRDYQVTGDDFAGWKQALSATESACLHTYAGMDHLFRKGEGIPGPHDYDRRAPVDPTVIDDIAAWIKGRRCPAGSVAPPAS
jgi:dienelactone hydrolase